MRVETDSIQIQEDRDVVSITLPPSQYSRTVTVTKGPQTTNHVCITENLPFGPAIICLSQQLPTCPNTSTINTSPAGATTSLCNERSARTPSPDITETRLSSSAADVSSISLDALDLGSHVSTPENTLSPDLPPPPSHLRECLLSDRFRVSQEVQKGYPPFSSGWSKLCWVVVFRGRDIGIFHDFWARIWPLIKSSEENIIPGAYWKKAEGEDDAFSKWSLAVGQGLTDRLL